MHATNKGLNRSLFIVQFSTLGLLSHSEEWGYARQKHHKSQLGECAYRPFRTEVSRLRNSYFDAALGERAASRSKAADCA